MTRLFLIRHCETNYTKERRYCGFKDLPLNPAGVKQAKKLARRTRNERFDVIYSSDLKRAYQTAKIISRGIPVKKDRALREMDLGIFEGNCYDEIASVYPKVYSRWLANPMKTRIPKGESLRQVQKRVLRALSRIIAARKDMNIVVVTHGGPARIILHELMGRDFDNFWKFGQGTGAVNVIEFRENKRPKVVRMNDTSYLKKKRKR